MAEEIVDGNVSTADEDGGPGDDFMAEVRKKYDLAYEYADENHREGADDLAFYALDQWDDGIKQDRESKDRPCLTIDQISQHVRQITGDIRLNKPSIKVRPVDDMADEAMADMRSGLIRNIEYQSRATNVYVKAGEGAAICGEAAFRLVTDYVGDDTFDQEIRIQTIRNPLAVLWDPDSREQTREDAKYCFVLEQMTKEAFKEKYPDASTASFDAREPEDWVHRWRHEGEIIVAEYWWKEPFKKTLWLMADGQTVDVTELSKDEREDLRAQHDAYFLATGMAAPPIPERKLDSHKVKRVLVNGAEVLEDEEEWLGRFIPIIPVFGEELHIGNDLRRRGIVRAAKDPQRMINYHASAAVEMVALAPKAPFVGTIRQFEGLESEWDDANTDNKAFLPYNTDPAAPGPPQRSAPPAVPAAYLSLKTDAENNLHAATGIWPSSLGQNAPETSGKAILARERQGDVGSYVFIDNLSIAIQYAGRQIIDLIPKVYDGERVLRILGEDETEKLIRVNAINQATGELENDLSVGRYDVVVQTGPSFSTKRQESAEAIMQFMQTVPDTAALVMDLLVKNMDWPGADEIHDRLRRQMVMSGMVEPDPEKGEQPPPPPPPDPEEIKAQADVAEAQARISKTEADVAMTRSEKSAQDLENAQMMMQLMLESGQLQAIMQRMAEEAATQAAVGAVAQAMANRQRPYTI